MRCQQSIFVIIVNIIGVCLEPWKFTDPLIHIENWIKLIGLVGKSPEENVTELCYSKKNENACLKKIKWRYIAVRVILLSPLRIENRGCFQECAFEN